MNKNTRVYWLHALTPLHVGAGRGLGYIDLPIMRERVTNWPLVPGSAIKGVISDIHCAEEARKKAKEDQELTEDEKRTLCAFGRAGDKHSNSGSLVFTDSHLVCLPVRSLYGTFAWCTSPLALQRLARDLQLADISPQVNSNSVQVSEEQCLVCRDSVLRDEEDRVFLEDLDFTASHSNDATQKWAKWLAEQIFAGEQTAWRSMFEQRFAILADNVFDFLCETGTEVNARVRIEDDKKTVASGALWYEEALPAETILNGLVWCDRVFDMNGYKPQAHELFDAYCCENSDLQIGGKATVGHGRVRCLFTNGGTKV